MAEAVRTPPAPPRPRVRPHLPAAGVDLVPFCPYPEFVARLLAAEYVFYWNVFSCSRLHRLAQARPVFFFDRGHVARAFAPSYELGVRCFYDGYEPVYLDPDAPLDRENLERRAADERAARLDIKRHLQRSPTPDQVVAALCA